MNSLEEIALKVAKDAFAEIYGPSTTDPDPALVKWISENARRLIAALGAQEPYGYIYFDKNMAMQFSHQHPDIYERFNMDCKRVFAAPVLPSVPEGRMPEGCDFEPQTAPEAFLQQEIRKMYTFEEIQYAWEESDAQGDWFEFVANLGVAPSPQEDAK